MADPVLTYNYPVSGTVAPTVAQAAQVNSISVTIRTGDTGSVVTHNWGLTSAQLANKWPWIGWTVEIPNLDAYDSGQVLLVLGRTANTITIFGDTRAFTCVVILQRPHSMVT